MLILLFVTFMIDAVLAKTVPALSVFRSFDITSTVSTNHPQDIRTADLYWTLDPLQVAANDVFRLNMPCVFRTKFAGSTLSLSAQNKVYAKCTANDASYLSTASYLDCVVASDFDSNLPLGVTGTISFDFTLNAGGSSGSADQYCASTYSGVSYQVNWDGLKKKIPITPGPYYDPIDNADELIIYSRTTPQNLEQIYFLAGGCPGGIQSGTLSFMTNDVLDCTKFKASSSDGLNQFYFPQNSSSVEFETSCSKNNQMVQLTIGRVESGSRVFFEGFEAFPQDRQDLIHYYGYRLTCGDGSTISKTTSKKIEILEGSFSETGSVVLPSATSPIVSASTNKVCTLCASSPSESTPGLASSIETGTSSGEDLFASGSRSSSSSTSSTEPTAQTTSSENMVTSQNTVGTSEDGKTAGITSSSASTGSAVSQASGSVGASQDEVTPSVSSSRASPDATVPQASSSAEATLTFSSSTYTSPVISASQSGASVPAEDPQPRTSTITDGSRTTVVITFCDPGCSSQTVVLENSSTVSEASTPPSVLVSSPQIKDETSPTPAATSTEAASSLPGAPETPAQASSAPAATAGPSVTIPSSKGSSQSLHPAATKTNATGESRGVAGASDTNSSKKRTSLGSDTSTSSPTTSSETTPRASTAPVSPSSETAASRGSGPDKTPASLSVSATPGDFGSFTNTTRSHRLSSAATDTNPLATTPSTTPAQRVWGTSLTTSSAGRTATTTSTVAQAPPRTTSSPAPPGASAVPPTVISQQLPRSQPPGNGGPVTVSYSGAARAGRGSPGGHHAAMALVWWFVL